MSTGQNAGCVVLAVLSLTKPNLFLKLPTWKHIMKMDTCHFTNYMFLLTCFYENAIRLKIVWNLFGSNCGRQI